MTKIPKALSRKNDKSSKWWIGLSLGLSCCILAWTFSLPFRSQSTLLSTVSPGESLQQKIDLVDQVKQRRSEAERYREAAIMLDEDFMRSVAEKNQPPRNLPNLKHSQRHWESRKESAKRQMTLLENPAKGSVEWEYAQTMMDSLRDLPAAQ